MNSIDSTHSLKSIREALCLAQSCLLNYGPELQKRQCSQVLANLIEDIDRQRPLGPDGKHNNRHTSQCGCEDK